MASTLAQHLDPQRTPKRILALDGGGIRGVLTLEYLEAIETLLRARLGGGRDFRLCHYFDLIGGTSTGSIIAAGLACGLSVGELKEIYRSLAKAVFVRSFVRRGLLVPKFPADPLRDALAQHLGATTTMGSDRIKTGLMVMTKRLDTGSPWPIHNNPAGRYFNPVTGTALPNKDFLLTQIVRASTAAPHYFEPEQIRVADHNDAAAQGAFVDGGVSPFNDPALQLLMLASLRGYGFRWATGADNILLISVGTGRFMSTAPASEIMRMPAAEQALRSMQALMDDCAQVNHTLLQWLSLSLNSWAIDVELGDMRADSAAGPQLATYVRYDALLRSDWLRDKLGVDWPPQKVEKVAAMDDPANVEDLAGLGRIAAKAQVRDEHFPGCFDRVE